MFEYIGTVQTTVRRLNHRLEAIAGKYGTNNKLYQDFVSKLDTFMPDNIRFKDGVVQITKPKQIYESPELSNNLENLQSELKTVTGFEKQFKTSYAEYKDYQETINEKPLTFSEYVTNILELPEALAYLYETKDNPKVSEQTRRNASRLIDVMKVKDEGRRTNNQLNMVIDFAGRIKQGGSPKKLGEKIEAMIDYWQPKE